MKIELKMTLKEADRLAVMKQIENKKLTLGQAAEELGLCYRQQIRIWLNYKKDGLKAAKVLSLVSVLPKYLPCLISASILEAHTIASRLVGNDSEILGAPFKRMQAR